MCKNKVNGVYFTVSHAFVYCYRVTGAAALRNLCQYDSEAKSLVVYNRGLDILASSLTKHASNGL